MQKEEKNIGCTMSELISTKQKKLWFASGRETS